MICCTEVRNVAQGQRLRITFLTKGPTNHMLPNFQPITILLYPSLQIVSSSSIQPFMLHGPDLTNILNYL